MNKPKAFGTQTAIANSVGGGAQSAALVHSAKSHQALSADHAEIDAGRVARINHTIPETLFILNCGKTLLYELINEAHVDRVSIGSRSLISDSSLRRLQRELELTVRINNVLEKKGQRVVIRLTRHRNCGRFFLVETAGDTMVERDVDLVALACSLNVLQPGAGGLDRASEAA